MKVIGAFFTAVFAAATITSVANGQLYQQDFSANFPTPSDPGMVTVLLESPDGDVIVPFVEFPVIGLTMYNGRPQVAARTGGANANQEVSEITSVYELDGNSTTVTYGEDDEWEAGGSNYDPEWGWLQDGFLTLSEDGIGSIQAGLAWDQKHDGAYDEITHTFAFQISGDGNPSNDQADGIGWAYLNSEENDITGLVGPGISEEPSYNQSLGVGFDIWDNGGEGGNSISLHFNGQMLESLPIDEGTTDPNTGDDWAFDSFEIDDIFTATIIQKPGTDQISEAELKGGSPYQIWNRSGADAELVQAGDPPSMEGFLRVVPEAGGTANVVAFDYAGSDPDGDFSTSFSFRGLNDNGNRADGMAFLLVPTDTYDEEGADLIAFGPHEEPNLAGALGIGFDTFNNDGAPQDEPEGMANTGNHISIHFDGEKLLQHDLDIAEEIDLVTDDPSVWHTAEAFVSGDNLTLIVTDGSDDSEHIIFDEEIDGLGNIGSFRPAFAARTGGAFDHYDIDNFVLGSGDPSVPGDYNSDGNVDVLDIDLQAIAMGLANPDLGIYDENDDGAVNAADRNIWVSVHKGTWMGDSNLDGAFTSSDLVLVFTNGKYESGTAAGWEDGDWNGDLVFSSSDLVTAFTDGGYESGPRAAVAAVPEPSSIVLLMVGSLLMLRVRRKS